MKSHPRETWLEAVMAKEMEETVRRTRPRWPNRKARRKLFAQGRKLAKPGSAMQQRAKVGSRAAP
jgi:hypothetical protein